MADVIKYSPEDVIVLLGGLIPVSGVTDGTFISLTKDRQPFTQKTSADGVVTRTYHSSTLYSLTLTLTSYSETNSLLTKIWLLDEYTKRAKFPILIKDTSGNSLFYGLSCWISSIPDTTYSTNISDRAWVLSCANAGVTIGGNDSESGITQDFFNAASSASATVNRILNLS